MAAMLNATHETGKDSVQNPEPFHKLLDVGQANQESPKKRICTVNLKYHDLLEFRSWLWLYNGTPVPNELPRCGPLDSNELTRCGRGG